MQLMKRIVILGVLFVALASRGGAELPSASLGIATYNLRYDLADDGPELVWSKRLPRIVSVVRKGGFDLVGFQEVTATMYPSLTNSLPEFVFGQWTAGRAGQCLAFRPETFERLDGGQFSLSEAPDDLTRVSWGSAGVRICRWALLRQRSNGVRLRVFNVHPDWKSGEARAKGMELVLERAKAAIAADERVIVLGDMNDMEGASFPWSPSEPKYPTGMSIRLAKAVLNDSQDISRSPHLGPVMTYQAFTTNATHRLDYIFVSDGIGVLSHRTYDNRPGGYPSDHDLVSARIAFDRINVRLRDNVKRSD